MGVSMDLPEQPSPERRQTKRLDAGIFLSTFFLLLLLGGNTPPYNDGKQIFDHAENIVYKGKIGIDIGPGVKFYNPRPIFVSLIHVPDVALRRAITALFPAADSLTRVVTSHLVPAALTATTCVLFARFVLLLGVGAPAASLSALLLAFGTMLFVFGRVVWSDIAQATAFWGFFSESLLLARRPGRNGAMKVGIWAGVLINTKYLFVLSLIGGFTFVATQLWTRLGTRKLAVVAGWAALAALPFSIPICWFNYIRNGTLFHGGYGIEPFQESIVWGLYSLLFSFGKGLFIYNPTLIFAFKPSSKLPNRWWWAVLATAGPVVLLYSKYSNWGGDWSWGPRYIIFLVPVLMVPVAVLLDEILCSRRRLTLAIFGAVAATGLFVQLMGAGLYWDHFIRLSQAATRQWLGTPDRSGGYTPLHGDHCDPCFEDLHGHTYFPAFQPIEGHYWLLKHTIKGDSWEQGVEDAPWRRYTSLRLDTTKRWYPWPGIDWWYLAFKGKFATAGKILFAFFLVGVACGAWLWAGFIAGCPFRRSMVPQTLSEQDDTAAQPGDDEGK
jgi:hypothetical protein